jgi:ATP-dependent RNA helicase RhlE
VNSFEPSGTSRSYPAAPPAPTSGDQVSPFAELGLLPAIVRATADEQYLEPTPVQRQVIPAAVTGRDVLACAQTGTGKTAAFVLPILHQLAGHPTGGGIRVLILTPTRELAAQIAERITAYGRYLRFRSAVIYGGVSQFRQEGALKQRPDLLVATPGRLLDLMGQGLVKLDQVAHFVLDEADRMLDMGFIHDVRRVIGALPKTRQTLFFSATVPRPIEALAQNLLVDPVRVSVTPKATAAETVDQSVVFVEKAHKGSLLEQLLRGGDVERAIVFTRTKHGADKLSRKLEQAGIDAPAIHGNKSQNARERALAGFRGGRTRVLVATDIAARGIDVDGVTHVFNFDLPNVPESYVHRVGRTGRAGASGRAISFCDREERPLLGDIERLLRKRLHVLDVPVPSAADGRAKEPARAASAGPSAVPVEGGVASSPEGADSRHDSVRPSADARPAHDAPRRPQSGDGRFGNDAGRRPHGGDGRFGNDGARRSHGGDARFGNDAARRPHGGDARFGNEAARRPHGGDARFGNDSARRPHGDARFSNDAGRRPQGGDGRFGNDSARRPYGDARPGYGAAQAPQGQRPERTQSHHGAPPPVLRGPRSSWRGSRPTSPRKDRG